jgi:uncharacterized protein (TIGR00251 family)
VDALPPYIREQNGLVCVSLKVQPRASRAEIGEVVGGELKVKVTAPPVDSAANAAVIELLSLQLDCPKSAVQLLRGATSRHKTIAIMGIPAAEVARHLRPGR